MKILAANWKMYLGAAEALQLAGAYRRLAETEPRIEFIVAPSTPWLVPVKDEWRARPKNLFLAAQSGRAEASGAYTGDTSIAQYRGVVDYCLVGHSERRRYHHEQGRIIQDQLAAVFAAGLRPIYCFGEQTGRAVRNVATELIAPLDVEIRDLTTAQLASLVFAYEPAWAIGSGKEAAADYVDTMVRAVRTHLAKRYEVPQATVLYGGSVNDDNSRDLTALPTLDGFLVGGASLHIKSMATIAKGFHTRYS